MREYGVSVQLTRSLFMTTGEIVFGGVNQARYSGYLQAVPIWPSVYEQAQDWVQ